MERVKVLVLGDSGVGKSALVAAITEDYHTQHETAKNRDRQPATIGAAISVRVHEFAQGTPRQRPVAVEFWDVGGSRAHALARPLLYGHPPPHGLLLVHDLHNRKSAAALRRWRAEALAGPHALQLDSILTQGSAAASLLPVDGPSFGYEELEADMEAAGAAGPLPVLLAGTKLDLAGTMAAGSAARPLAEEWQADELHLDALSATAFAPGSTNAVKLSRFLDKVVAERHRSAGLPLPSFLPRQPTSPTFSTGVNLGYKFSHAD